MRNQPVQDKVDVRLVLAGDAVHGALVGRKLLHDVQKSSGGPRQGIVHMWGELK